LSDFDLSSSVTNLAVKFTRFLSADGTLSHTDRKCLKLGGNVCRILTISACSDTWHSMLFNSSAIIFSLFMCAITE
jgi:hypothetical protein